MENYDHVTSDAFAGGIPSLYDLLIILRQWDESASKALVAPPSMRNVLMWIEYTVNGYPWIIGSSLALVYSKICKNRRPPLPSPYVGYQRNVRGLLSDLCCNGILKLSIQRPRPAYNINDQLLLPYKEVVHRLVQSSKPGEKSRCRSYQFLEAPVFDRFSFPSGHTTRAAMLATLCAAFFPKYRFAAAGLTFLVGLSRVAMGRHYLSDVLAGLALGYLEGLAALALPYSVTNWSLSEKYLGPSKNIRLVQKMKDAFAQTRLGYR
ncbi:PAP2 family protein [Ancylostoma duodenale]|uniref:PAP2 family protein n=1 Tax=Ancylostoma duodenale TaxID=51022 RepID=A0A0C2FJH4_9BILA|nr:PAP2 family protein [Ancylostoma duodenale]